MSTASGIIVSGDQDGNVFVLDGKSGQRLWNYQIGAAVYAAPITFQVDGKQYILVGAGTNLTAFALR